jgi:hypothetical protein
MNIRLTSFVFAAMLSLTAAPAAHAAADEAMLARLKAFAAEQGTTLEWESVQEYDDQDGKAVTALINARVGAGNEQVTIDNLELIDVSEVDGGWRIGTVRVPTQRHEENETVVDIYDFTLSGLVVPEQSAPDEIPTYEGAALREMVVTEKGKQVFAMNDLHVEVTYEEDGGPMEFTGAAESFRISLEGVEDESVRGPVQAMGYENIEGFFEVEGSWNPADGMLELSKYDITVNEAGTFGISLRIGGYTREFLASLRQVQEQMAANPGGDDSAANMAMLGLMQQLTFHSARIEFVDDSLTNRSLDLIAQQQGQQRAAIANQAKAVVPFMLMQLNNPELTQQAATAVSAFLDDPQNLAITAEPATPMPFALLVAGAMSAPQALPQQLGVKVLANE